MRRFWISLLVVMLLALPAGAKESAPADAGCRACHWDYAPPIPPVRPGRLLCTSCHLGRGRAREPAQGHRGLVANPSALDQAERACGACHRGRTRQVQSSPMATAAGIINQTRFLWGAQPDTQPRYGVRPAPGLMALPTPDETGQAVDAFLRQRCLRCHLWVEGADLAGARRSSGCAACHRPNPEEGRRPPGHHITRRVPVSQCLRCHAGCGAGAEYTGRIPRDAHRQARFLQKDPRRPRLWQGRTWRPMQPDLHFQAGLACIDCHGPADVMGDGRVRAAGLLQVGVRCTTCHGRPGRPPQGRTTRGRRLAGLRLGPGPPVLRSKLGGKSLPVPLLAGGKGAPVAHRVEAHARVACHACHSATNPAAWGLQVLRETRGRALAQWRYLAAQGDPQVLALLDRPPPPPPWRALPPWSRDYLDGRLRPGLWILSPFFRRFRWRIYGRGPDGRSFLLAPRFQYLVTLLDRRGRLIESAARPRPGLGLTPWHPHTTARATVACSDCHGNPTALGLGLTFAVPDAKGIRLAPRLWRPRDEGLAVPDWTQAVDRKGRPLQALLVPGSRPYGKEMLERLLRPGPDYRRWLIEALEEQWPWRKATRAGDRQGSTTPGTPGATAPLRAGGR